MKENNKNNVVNKIMSFPQVVGGHLPLTRSFVKKVEPPYFVSCLTSPLAGEDARRAGEGDIKQSSFNPLIGLSGLRPSNHFPRGAARRVGSHTTQRRGFTLIELLVVVLIIGILAAVAVPQYQKAVDKARYTQAMTLGKQIWNAQQRYYLANGSYASQFDELDLDMPAPTSIQQNGTHYFYNWGYCWLSNGQYSACAIDVGTPARAWYFSMYNSPNHACWAYPGGNKRANALCQAVTKKSTGTLNNGGFYKAYEF